MNKRIVDFIKENKVLTVCCTDGNGKPYCFHCFYAFDETHCLLFFKSSAQSYHSGLLAENPQVAGGILPDDVELLTLKGIQLTGSVMYRDFPGDIHPEDLYHRKFPFALVRPGNVWCLQIDSVKMTDNMHIFGAKLDWSRNEALI